MRCQTLWKSTVESTGSWSYRKQWLQLMSACKDSDLGKEGEFKFVYSKGSVSYTLRSSISQVHKGHNSEERYLGLISL